jgi:fucose 4-O-acetylase-like acetyltransferase
MTDEPTCPIRDTKLDLLRGIGLLCIILAHVGPWGFISQLRNFDVPLMVLVSGAAFSLPREQNEQYGQYLYSRFVRLIIPTWAFLSLFFVIVFIASFISNSPYPFSAQKMLSSFTLTNWDGIGFVWIIRVFFLVALIAPYAKKVLTSNRQALLGLLFGFIYIVYEVLAHYFFLGKTTTGVVDAIFKEYVFYVIPYGIIFVIGILMQQLSLIRRLKASVLLLLVFSCICLWLHITTGNFVFSELYKYPPKIYYLSYAVGVSLLLSWLVELLHIDSMLLGRILAWIGCRTLWTYLWHILILYFLKLINFSYNFVIKFFMVAIIAIFITVVQERIVKYIISHDGAYNKRKLIEKVFIG